MHHIFAAEVTLTDYIPVLVQLLVTVAAIFGGTGYWQYKQSKEQAKRDEESKEKGVEKKVDTLTEKVDDLVGDVKELRSDISLLKAANAESVRYRESREARDESDLIAQKAIIESLTGILRERLIENYNKCIKKGYYTKTEREVYKEMYRCYTQPPFDGNGVIHDLQPIMVALPWTPEEAERRKKMKNS